MACLRDDHAHFEFTHRAVADRNAIVAVVDHARVAGLPAGTLPERPAVSVDHMTAEVERDVVGADYDPIVRAIHEITIEHSVGGDGNAAADVARGRLTGAGSQPPAHHEHYKRDDYPLHRHPFGRVRCPVV